MFVRGFAMQASKTFSAQLADQPILWPPLYSAWIRGVQLVCLSGASVLLSLDHSKECREVKKFPLCLKLYLAVMQPFPL